MEPNMQNKKLIKMSIVTGIILVVILVIPKRYVRFEVSVSGMMNTDAVIKAMAKNKSDAQRAVRDALKALRKIEELANAHNGESEISKVNSNAAEKAVKVSDELFELFDESEKFSKMSDGAFDITVGPLLELWKTAAETNQPPSAGEIVAVKKKVGYDKLLLDPRKKTILFAVRDMRIDLGGIAKCYAVDKAIEAMKAAGAVGGMVDVGGDISCFGVPFSGKKFWLIGLQNPAVDSPDDNSKKLLLELRLEDAAVATSGHYRRGYSIAGQTVSHIIDPATGRGSNALSSVTIIALTAAQADAVATAVTVMGKEKGLKLIENSPGVEAILISPAPNYEITYSSDVKKYLK